MPLARHNLERVEVPQDQIRDHLSQSCCAYMCACTRGGPCVRVCVRAHVSECLLGGEVAHSGFPHRLHLDRCAPFAYDEAADVEQRSQLRSRKTCQCAWAAASRLGTRSAWAVVLEHSGVPAINSARLGGGGSKRLLHTLQRNCRSSRS
jgi:hypothetical protein